MKDVTAAVVAIAVPWKTGVVASTKRGATRAGSHLGRLRVVEGDDSLALDEK
jgi:hypothetical protein